jgi:site-specific DNA-methyltransferase (adenine-specific)
MIRVGDCRQVLRDVPDSFVDAVVTDPPYELGFMGKGWDASGIAYDVEMWREVLRVLKPGGHLLGFGGSRTYHRLACAIEDAGFEIRDQIMWVYGSGFPKSLNVSKAIDKAAGAERQVVGYSKGVTVSADDNRHGGINRGAVGIKQTAVDVPVTAPATPDAEKWEGWGTALKPAHEPIVVARKPLDGTVAGNVLEWGVGAINIDGCRIGTEKRTYGGMSPNKPDVGTFRDDNWVPKKIEVTVAGRWPANFIHDGSDEVLELFPDTASTGNGTRQGHRRGGGDGVSVGLAGVKYAADGYADGGSAARFFYCAKANKKERNAGLDEFPERAVSEDYRPNDDGTNDLSSRRHGKTTPRANHHPTVKPIQLMRYLCRLVTPPSGLILDPFTGSGTTGIAATLEGFDFVGIEQDPEYTQIALTRIQHHQDSR